MFQKLNLKRFKFGVITLLLSFLAIGFNSKLKSKEYDTADKVKLEENQETVKDKLKKLKRRVKFLEDGEIDLLDSVSCIDRELWDARLDLEHLKVTAAVFNASRDINKGIQVLKDKLGTLFIGIDSVTPYLDGYKIRLKVGNPQYATYHNFALEVQWNEKWPEKKIEGKSWSEKTEEWINNMKTQVYNISKPLLPGSWNNIEIFLAPAKLNEIAYARFVIKKVTIALSEDGRPV